MNALYEFFNIFMHKICQAITTLRFTPLSRVKEGLLIDVTETTRVDLGTGIQRVVNNVFREILCHNKNNKEVIAVRNYYGKLITSFTYVRRLTGLERRREALISFYDHDKLLLLDSSWAYVKDYSNLLTNVFTHKIIIYAVVYDMFPVQYPELFDSPKFISKFCDWHNMILQKSNAILCISRTTADVVIDYYEKNHFQRKKPLHFYYFHMGADMPTGSQNARKNIQDFVDKGKVVFLMVGTLEPRKGHMVALQAFRKVIQEQENDCRLLIIGHNGWKNDEIKNQLAMPEYKDKVLWVQDALDEELRWAYAHSDALIAASRDEGFGLPLVEAAHFGLPIICSDIPIFREVTQGNADYFKVMDADDLARCITAWLQTEKHPDSHNIRIYTWQESAQEILDIIDGKVEPYKVLL